MRLLRTYTLYLLVSLLFCPCLTATGAETTADVSVDSIRQAIPRLKGDARRDAWQTLYNQMLATGDMKLMMKCLDEWQTDAERQHDLIGSCNVRTNRLVDYFNAGLYDSIFAVAPEAMDYHLSQGQSRHYFRVWHLLVCAYEMSGRYNQALREVRQMHDEAVRQKDSFGEGIAYFDMGTIYQNMNHLDEAIDAFEKSLQLLSLAPDNVNGLAELYPFYCDALEAKKDFQKLEQVTDTWKAFLDTQRSAGMKGGYKYDLAPMTANYYIACTQAQLGLGNLAEARRTLDEAERLLPDREAFEWLYVLFYRAQLCLLSGQYDEALRLNGERLRLCDVIDDKPTLIPVNRQRAEILMAAGRYREAAQMYRRTYELNDSLNTASTRMQLNELNTLFRVDELKMNNALQRSRYVTIIVALVAVALLLFLILVFRWTRLLRRKNEALAQSNEELKLANERAKESSQMKTAFIHNISHEIRTPLNVLNGFTQLVTMPDIKMSNEEREEARKRINDNTERITEVVNKMLELSDASSHSVIERVDTVSANLLAAEAVSAAHVDSQTLPGNPTAKVSFKFESSLSDEQTVLTNRRYAVRALSLLLKNAVKFTREGSIVLRTELTGDELRFTVEDTGIGVPPAEAERIFEEFVQLDSYADGVGIGLTVARSLARRMGGDVQLDTSYQSGARFVMTLKN